MLCRFVRSKICLRKKLNKLQHICNEKRGRAEKGDKTIQVLQKDLKLAKTAITAAEI